MVNKKEKNRTIALKSKYKSGVISKEMAIASFVINFFIPGLGSLIAGKTKPGIWQLILAIVSLPLFLIIVGIITWIAAWIWALFTSINIIKEAK